MRKISFLLALAFVLFTFSASATFAATDFPNTSTNGMIGFAGQAKSEAGASKPATTGGKNGQVIYINNLNELKNQLGDSTPKILVIEKNISASSKTVINIGSNKSLIGSYAQNKLINIHLKTTANSGNVIFQNLTFEHSASINGNDDIQLYLTAGTNYWIDHVTFAGHNYNANGWIWTSFCT